jgi:hypothetical protein
MRTPSVELPFLGHDEGGDCHTYVIINVANIIWQAIDQGGVVFGGSREACVAQKTHTLWLGGDG